MLLAGRDFESLAGAEQKIVPFDFESEFSFEHVEELASMNVGVANLAGARRHELFDHAEFGSFDEMPTVAVSRLRTAPFVVFGRFLVDGPAGHRGRFLWFRRILMGKENSYSMMGKY
jgi:hypothetical protein